VPILLSLCSALAFGAGDFLGGVSARRAPALSAAFVMLLTGLALLSLWVPWTAEHGPSGATLGFGALAGVSGSLAALALYPALAIGNASEVAPLSAVVGTAGPVLFGVLVGERPSPSAWAGILLAALAIVLVSASGAPAGAGALEPARRRRSLVLAAVSGVLIGVFLISFERAGPEQGLLPLLVARATAVLLFALLLFLHRQRPWPAGVSPAPALACGVLDIAANACYLLALARAPLSIVATLANLYPAFTVLLGMVFLRDRPRLVQQLGLALALGAVVLIAR
jgi:uncharacterized membrane protein